MSFQALRRIVGSGACALFALVAGCGGGGVQSGLRVEIIATPNTGAYPLTVSLKANVNGQPAPDEATFEWDLGDGETSTDASPVHVFSDIGSYEVSVKVKHKGKKGAASHTIEVLEVGPGTDIVVESVESTQTILNPGSPISVKVTLRNRGTTPADNAFGNRIYLSTIENGLDPLTAGPGQYILNVSGIGGEETIDVTANFDVPSAFEEAEYWVWVYADSGLAVDEFDEFNNVTRSSTKVNVTTGTLPIDLEVTEPVLSGTTFMPGSPVNVSTTLSNTGTLDAPPFELTVVLSPDPQIDAGDMALHTATFDGLAAGASAPQSFDVDVPADVINRPWYLGVIADATNANNETAEANNRAAYGASTVLTTGGSGCTEDANEPNDSDAEATPISVGTLASLQLCGATTDWFRIDLGAGDRLSSTIDFQNVNGNLDLEVWRMGDQAPLETSNSSSNVESVNSGYALSAGTYLLRVTLAGSAGGNAYELDAAIEDNGGAGIDLVPTSVVFGEDGGPYAQGVAHPVDVTVYNFGMTASTSFDVALYLSADTVVDGGDADLGTTTVASLGSGGNMVDSRSVTIPMSTPDGYYNVIAVADSGDDIGEEVEGNNLFTLQIPVAVGCLDDLFEPNQTTGSATPVGNGTYENLEICAGGAANGDWYAITTGPGGTIDVDMTIDADGGDLDLFLRLADGSSPSDCGTAPNDCDSLSGSNLPEHVQYTSVAGGTYYVRAEGYTTNTGGYTLTVSGSTGVTPDFVPNGVTVTPENASAGDEVQVDGRIKNNSTEDSPAFDWIVRLSPDATIDGGDTTLATVMGEAALLAGENRLVSKKVTLPGALAAGDYWLGIVADPTGMVEEGSEANNVGVSAMPVQVMALCVDDAHEENDTAGSAGAIALGGTISSLIVCSGDPDYYAVTPGSAGTLNVHVDFVDADGDLDLHLYQQGQSLPVAASVSQTDDEDISYAVSAGQTYLIRVSGFNDASNTYTLDATLAP